MSHKINLSFLQNCPFKVDSAKSSTTGTVKNSTLSRCADVVFKPRPLKRALFPCERITVRQNRFSSGILENRGAGVFLEQSDALLK